MAGKAAHYMWCWTVRTLVFSGMRVGQLNRWRKHTRTNTHTHTQESCCTTRLDVLTSLAGHRHHQATGQCLGGQVCDDVS